MGDHEDLKEIKRLKAELSKQHRIDASRVCERARTAIRWHLIPSTEHCALAENEIEWCFVFRFAKWDGVAWKHETFSVRKEMIEDGIMSEQRLKAALWDALGRLRGMV